MRIKTGQAQQGVAIVEFTVTLPVVLLLMLGIAEFGNAFASYNTLTRAVQDGTRYVADQAIGNGSGVVDISANLRDRARNLVVYGNVNGGTEPILPDLTVNDISVLDDGEGNITIIAAYGYPGFFPGALPTFRNGGSIDTLFTMRAQVTMRALA